MANSANLPAPFLGQDTLTPTAVLKSPYCETLFNFNTTEAGVSLRNGDSIWASKALNSTGGATEERFRSFIPYGTTQLFMAVQCSGGVTAVRYYGISTEGGAPTLEYTSVSGIGGEIFYNYFNGRVFTFGNFGTGVGDYYDGSAWGASTYSFAGGAEPVGACTFKNRQYFILKDSSSYGYSELEAVTGTVTTVPLAGVIAEKGTLLVIAPITLSNQVSSEQLLAFVFSTGEVLFYGGSYPDSASWNLVGTGTIDIPLNYNSAISPYRGDSLVACRNGLYSLRDLFLKGSQEAINAVVSRQITPTWTRLVSAILAGGSTYVNPDGRLIYSAIAWWKLQNRVIVSFRGYVDDSGNLQAGGTYFVLDTLRGSWSVHRSFGINTSGTSNFIQDLIVFKDEALFCSNMLANAGSTMIIASKEGGTDFQDVDTTSTKVSFDYALLSAPIPFPKTAVYEATQIEPILESDLYAQTNWNLVADFGRQTSGNQKTDAATTAVAKPAVNVGMQNITYVQVKMSGTTAASKSVGLDLYSYNVWYDYGSEASR